jgi:hypothetical protein
MFDSSKETLNVNSQQDGIQEFIRLTVVGKKNLYVNGKYPASYASTRLQWADYPIRLLQQTRGFLLLTSAWRKYVLPLNLSPNSGGCRGVEVLVHKSSHRRTEPHRGNLHLYQTGGAAAGALRQH